MTQTNPYEVLEIVDSDLWPEDYDPYEAILLNFAPENLADLSRVLLSSDTRVSRRGLSAFGELGHKAFPVVDDALMSVCHPDSRARNGLVDGLLCYPQRLSAKQLRQILSIEDIHSLSDPLATVVRGKIIAIVGAVRPSVILEAIEEIADAHLRALHLEAFISASKKIGDVQRCFDEARKLSDVDAIYSFANLIWAARDGDIEVAPSYEGDDYLDGTVVRQIQRVIDGFFRKNNPVAWREKLVVQRRKSSPGDG
jgi:hypothetical protein